MSKKLAILGITLLLMFVGVFEIYNESEEADAATMTISATSLGHSTVTVSSGNQSQSSHGGTASITVNTGSSVTFTAVMDSGYRFNGWATSNTFVSYDNPFTYPLSASTELFCGETATTGNINVSFTSGSGGSVAPDSITGIPYNSQISINNNSLTIDGSSVLATPSAGHSFVSWTVNGNPIQSGDRVTQDMTIQANFDVNDCVLTFLASPSDYGYMDMDAAPSAVGNTLTVPAGTQIYISNDSVMIEISPFTQWVYGNPASDSGGYHYYFDHWNYGEGSRTVTEDMTFIGYFSRSSQAYTVSFIAHTGGSVSPNTISSVPYGASITVSNNTVRINGQTVTATPSAGYSFSEWINASGTITGNRQIVAEFVRDTMTISATSLGHSTVTVSSGNQSQSSHGGTASITIPTGSSVTFTAVMDSGYLFNGWATSNTFVSDENPFIYSLSASTELFCGEIPPVVVTFDASTNGGTVDGSSTKTVTYGQLYGTLPSAHKIGANFLGWFTSATGGTMITASSRVITVTDQTLYAQFIEVNPQAVFWSNDNYNGRVDVLFKFDASDNKTHIMTMDLLNGTVAEDQSTTFTDSGFDLRVETSYPSFNVTAALTWSGGGVSNSLALGNWNTFIVSIDTDMGEVYVTPVKTFENFTDFTVYEKQKKTVLDFSDKIKGAAVHDINHSESVEGTNSPRFSVVGTSVFLNTFGIVLNNPTINLHDYFPQYESIRVNFYSFALYGESITINGQTWPVDGSKITVQYVSDGSDHYLPGVMPNATVQTRTFELSNIYVTYQDGHCYLTFVNDRFTIDLGAYTPGNETISMQGLWYFATMVYEPYTAIEKHLSDWKILPETDKSQMVLLFLAILVLAGAAVAIHARKSGLGIVDLVIIGAALIFGLVLLG